MSPDRRPIAVVALGGNALMPRGTTPDGDNQLHAARRAAQKMSEAVDEYRLVVTHGNGPQIGLLALMEAEGGNTPVSTLDVLDAETEGQLGYLIEMEIDNATVDLETAALITRVVVDRDDPAFDRPTKFIGQTYDEQSARDLARERGWKVEPDGGDWRRVVPSPEPREIVQMPAIRRLVDSGFLVVCAGGGGIPVVRDSDGHRGVEAVIDKDLCSALLATELEAEVLVLATDVEAVFLNWGEPGEQPVLETTAAALRRHEFAEGSMGPKVEAGCRMAESTGGRAAIGSLDRLDDLLAGSCGTQIREQPS